MRGLPATWTWSSQVVTSSDPGVEQSLRKSLVHGFYPIFQASDRGDRE